jgi:hypothetical protein
MAIRENVPDLPIPVPPQNATPIGGNGSSRNPDNTLASLGAELLRRATESQLALEAAWDDLMQKWGIHGEPIDIQVLRERIQQECGTKPEENAFSREIIALREDRWP